MQIDISKLDLAIDSLKATLKDGVLAADIWDRATGLSLASINSQPAAVALFTEITNSLTDTLVSSGFPGLNRYYFVDLEGGKTVLVIQHGTDILEGILMDTAKVNLGILLAVALPKALEAVKAARI